MPGLRPKEMSKVSVVGSKRVLDDVIESLYRLDLLHMEDYDGSWEGFDNGDPLDLGEEASEKLVQIRSIQNILGVEDDDYSRSRGFDLDDDEIESRLETVRQKVNDLEDERDDLRDQLREVRDQKSSLEPFAELGVELDLLRGYDSIDVVVGETDDLDDVKDVLRSSEEVDEFETIGSSDVVAVAATVTDDTDLSDVLVGASFSAVEVPEAEGSPKELLRELETRQNRLESELDDLDSVREEIKNNSADFLLAAEEALTVDVEKAEAPLRFATTENSFVVEGWIPTETFDELESRIKDVVGGHVEIRELERAQHGDSGHSHGDEEEDSPPVVQDNPDPAKPFEILVKAVSLPKYSEFDPTVFLLLTFPVFFGFMIGDLGYGLLYLGIGAVLYTKFESPAMRSLGGLTLWAGGLTAVFGVLYGEIFGLHILGDVIWGGHPPIHKGLQPAFGDYALGWVVLSLFVGLLHLTVGWITDFIENLEHGFSDAMTESGSWLMMMFGLWTWIFAGASGKAPPILVGSESVFAGNPFPLGFTGFPPTVGLGGLAVFFIGLVLLVYGEPIEGVEFLNVLVNVLSYTRLAAVLLAKAGMAFVVNLLFFGVYVTGEGEHAEWHFGLGHMPHVGDMVHGHEVTEIMFGGLSHSGIAGVIFGIVVLILGHTLVLALGITSAGLQAVRLEYVEFFGKFYEGGGETYEPFGFERKYTTEE
ncbi:MAG: V-type ATP synthase subunit I [Halobacteria archaeon]|nr:V-type ATP synthase subunit I [Halobacteria archaeon]